MNDKQKKIEKSKIIFENIELLMGNRSWMDLSFSIGRSKNYLLAMKSKYLIPPLILLEEIADTLDVSLIDLTTKSKKNVRGIDTFIDTVQKKVNEDDIPKLLKLLISIDEDDLPVVIRLCEKYILNKD